VIPGDSNCQNNLTANTYAITVTDRTGCTAVAIATVGEPDELIATAEAINVSCYGFGDGQGVVNVTGGTEPYSYLWSTPDSADTESISDLIPESYSVTVTDTNGCTATSAMNINQPDSFIVTAGNDTATFAGYSVTLYVAGVTGGNGNETYQWTPDADVTSPQAATTTAIPGESTPYVITVTDENGCIATDTLFVQVDENLYTFPDGFVPNGQNNIFMPVISSTVTVLKLEIFNRWGQLVGNDPTGWDGKYNGELQPMDTYVYQAVLQLPDQSQKTERGDFILIW
jgi:gliding motility-associated-like protein